MTESGKTTFFQVSTSRWWTWRNAKCLTHNTTLWVRSEAACWVSRITVHVLSRINILYWREDSLSEGKRIKYWNTTTFTMSGWIWRETYRREWTMCRLFLLTSKRLLFLILKITSMDWIEVTFWMGNSWINMDIGLETGDTIAIIVRLFMRWMCWCSTHAPIAIWSFLSLT